MPYVRIGVPQLCIFAQNIRSVVQWIDGDRYECQPSIFVRRKPFLDGGKVCRQPRAHISVRATRIDEVNNHYASAKIRQTNPPPALVDKTEIRERIAHPQPVSRELHLGIR